MERIYICLKQNKLKLNDYNIYLEGLCVGLGGEYDGDVGEYDGDVGLHRRNKLSNKVIVNKTQIYK